MELYYIPSPLFRIFAHTGSKNNTGKGVVDSPSSVTGTEVDIDNHNNPTLSRTINRGSKCNLNIQLNCCTF